LVGYAARHWACSVGWRLFLCPGLLGGFTTCSAFGLETANLLKRGDRAMAALYVLASLACGLAAIGLAYRFTP